jgi:enoyl-CoA hydratase/carnithine racemase
MDEIITERSGSILRVQLNRPTKKNAMTSSMYVNAGSGFVTHVVPEQNLMTTATETARKLAAKPAQALETSKQLMKRPFREQVKAAMAAENREFSARVRSEEAKEALGAFLEKRRLPAESAR